MVKYIICGVVSALLSWCYPSAVGSSVDRKPEPKVEATKKAVNANTVCYDGILYFTVWNNNPFDAPYITGAKIDPKTSKPQTCTN